MTTDTIPGGAYKLPDGTWVNANGKRIPAPKNLPDMWAEAPEPTEPEEIPGRVMTGGDEFGEEPELEADPKPATRSSRSKRLKGDS